MSVRESDRLPEAVQLEAGNSNFLSVLIQLGDSSDEHLQQCY